MSKRIIKLNRNRCLSQKRPLSQYIYILYILFELILLNQIIKSLYIYNYINIVWPLVIITGLYIIITFINFILAIFILLNGNGNGQGPGAGLFEGITLLIIRIIEFIMLIFSFVIIGYSYFELQSNNILFCYLMSFFICGIIDIILFINCLFVISPCRHKYGCNCDFNEPEY